MIVGCSHVEGSVEFTRVSLRSWLFNLRF